MTFLLKGAPLLEAAKNKARIFSQQVKTPPHLAIILVGESPASIIYTNMKKKVSEAVGFQCTLHSLPSDMKEPDLSALILRLNKDTTVHGILIQLPLPDHFNRQRMLDTVHPDKDVDGLTSYNAGHLLTNTPRLVPCTPLGCMALIKQWNPHIVGKHAIVIGQSTLVGKPLDLLLLQQGCTVTMAHEHTADLPQLSQTADIVISAVGKQHLVKKGWVKPDACVIDVGINTKDNCITGDVDFNEVHDIAAAITPVPGGIGPATIAYLLHNLMQAYQYQQA